jgi:hypothetical protein
MVLTAIWGIGLLIFFGAILPSSCAEPRASRLARVGHCAEFSTGPG